MRILLFGNSGSGKSVLAQKLATEHGLKHLDLDTLVWEPGKIAVPRPPEAVQRDLQAFFAAESHWVVEGCYGEWVLFATPFCTALYFLNPGLEVCIQHCLDRPWEPHKYESKEAQDAMLPGLIGWVKGYYEREDAWSLKEHRKIFDRFEGEKLELR
jgi:adenylate kinase family enzyme